MNPPLLPWRARTCDGKKSFLSAQLAANFATGLAWADGGEPGPTWAVYGCDECSGFHFTRHARAKVVAAAREGQPSEPFAAT
ncbi:hypothetical protein [Phycicoccus sp.]|uniref:hypothetical protein n=1 Tax=Phycicoccus sp. TaxID=1902410 RepID=UPI002BBEE7A9|nr:hypothetical protein [Phycicoccus sp.]HMM95322.1 hypothetical protein [Phycicoccus sp.]